MRSIAVIMIGVALLMVAGVGAYLFWAGSSAENGDASATDQAAAENAAGDEDVSAATEGAGAARTGGFTVDGRVVPAEQADLSFPIGGTVVDLPVAEGQVVGEGQLIASLNSAQQRTAVSRAEAELQRAQADYDDLATGARPEEIAQAEANLQAAQARLARLTNGTLPGEVAAAQAALSSAQANRQRVLDGASEQEVIVARADLANAEAALSQVQAAYDKVKWSNEVGALPESAALQQATNNYEAAKARWEDLQQGPTQAELDQASAEVARAQAQLDELESGLPQDVLAAEADVRNAQAQLDLLKAGAATEELAAAQAEVAAATAALQQALVSLGESELRAPFTGTVALLNVSAGEQVAASEVVARLGDLEHWEIRTEDLTELEIGSVVVGEKVEVGFDALPDLQLTGTVDRIRPLGNDLRGDIVYTVVIIPDTQDPRLLWNMTAVVNFPE